MPVATTFIMIWTEGRRSGIDAKTKGWWKTAPVDFIQVIFSASRSSRQKLPHLRIDELRCLFGGKPGEKVHQFCV